MALDQNNLQSGKKLNDTLDFDLLPPCPEICDFLYSSNDEEDEDTPPDYAMDNVDYSSDEEDEVFRQDTLGDIEREESIKSKPKLADGKGRLFVISRSDPHSNSPALKGTIKLDNKYYVLSGWIRKSKNSNSKYISLLVSKTETELEGKVVYKTIGKGLLRFSKQTAPKQPTYRGEIEFRTDGKAFSLSAWHTSYRKNEILSINSHPIKTFSYSDIQKKLDKIN